MLIKIILSLNFLWISQVSFAEVINRAAGRVSDHIVTSREVMINSLYEDAMYRSQSPKQIQNLEFNHRSFVRECTGILLEWAIFMESKSFKATLPLKKDIEANVSKAKQKLRKSQAWQEAQVSHKELTDLVERKLQTKALIQTRLSAANIPVTDQEAEEYFKANKFKFEDLPFEKLKSNIKLFLSKQQSESRMREWFELLQIKYKVRNFLAEDNS
jgi:hypothetical protein